ncbi:hypothetical protein RB213_013314 [Colletotrichum asianum]
MSGARLEAQCNVRDSCMRIGEGHDTLLQGMQWNHEPSAGRGLAENRQAEEREL